MRNRMAIIAMVLLILTGCATSKPVPYPHESCAEVKVEECTSSVSINPLAIALWILVGGGY